MIAEHKLYSRFVFLISAVLVFGSSFAQTVTPQNELDKKYTPNENSIFYSRNGTSRNGNLSGPDKPEVTISNAIKFVPTALFRYTVQFQYEREIVGPLAGVVGLGKAFGSDAIEAVGSELSTFSTSSPNVLTYSDVREYSSFKTGKLTYYASMKLYFSGKSFDGSYVEFSYRRNRVVYELYPAVNSIKVDTDNTVQFTTSGFSFGYGYLGTAGPKNNITHEFFFNFGIKNVSFSQFEKVYVGSPYFPGGNNDYIYQRGVGEITYRIIPSINMGYIFGFGF